MLAGGIAVSVVAASWIVVTFAKGMASRASTTTEPALNLSVRRHAGSWQPSVVRSEVARLSLLQAKFSKASTVPPSVRPTVMTLARTLTTASPTPTGENGG